MVHQVITLLIAGGLISAVHALGPDHWLPHVVVSRAQGWTLAKALRVTLVAATAHIGLTVVLGLLIIFLLAEVEPALEALTSTVMAFILAAIGLLFVARGFLRPEHTHRTMMSDGAATAILVLVAAFPPCYAILPLFLAAGIYGWGIAVGLALTFSVITIAVMLVLVTLGRRGYTAIERSRLIRLLERREPFIVGVVFILLSLVVAAGL